MKNDSLFIEASAPGRLDIMGGIADYSGSLVLQLPIRQKTIVRITLRTDYQCTVHSETRENGIFESSVDFRTLLLDGEVNYAFAQHQFREDKGTAWTAYVLGCVLVLQKEKNIQFKGADFVIQSDVPLGKGVSSSAALEVATMKALSAAFAISFSGTELPTLAQRAENLVVGAPCGLMDQLTSFFGEPRKLLPILCQPDKIMEPIPLPPDVFFLGIDSGIRHSIGGSSYADVRCAAFMGYSMIAQAAGASVEDILAAIEGGNLSELPYHGYLCAISATEFEERYKQVLPEFMTGKDFLSLYSRTIDPVTTVDEATRYAIFNCASHPVYEHARVGQYVEYVRALPSSDQASREILLRNMGALMFQSHERYSRCGLGSERTDEIVTLAKERAGEGIFGAKITGGGNGGTVCLLAEGKKGKDAVRELHAFFVDKYKTKLAFFEM